jgi:DNA-binding PadR family transcriptional regulator
MGTDRDRRTIDDRLPLRPVEFHILLSLAAGERHGYGIILDIEERGDAPVPDVGTMYRALARMVESGFIEAAARRPAPDARDERRNYYRITEAGRRVASAEAQRLETLTRAARIGGLLPKAAKS